MLIHASMFTTRIRFGIALVGVSSPIDTIRYCIRVLPQLLGSQFRQSYLRIRLELAIHIVVEPSDTSSQVPTVDGRERR